ncbi:nitrogen regulation protein NR(II) [Immundisolibacter sp.]|uniref:nitrogen regulation protein NR(II) n=1 Tax=Immundisolibacter sp. TaxID=1934948 RepID=UPI0026287AFF|nr:nitrogen regulation protein NR(II) [Immundisolibacter sp.]MDD3651654.1 nitrogen regulation protein NR(II) [Immundisolibacter sp.]
MHTSPDNSAPADDQVGQLVLDNLQTAVVVIDAELRVTYLNQAAEVLLGASARQLRGQPLESLLHVPGLPAMLTETLQRQQPVLQHDLPFAPPGGPAKRLDCWLTPLDATGSHRLVLEIAATGPLGDAQRESQLLAQQEANRLMLRGLAHEIKNPLGGLRGAAQLLERELADPDLTEFTQIIIGEADRLKHLVDRMLSSELAPEMARVSVHEVLERVRTLVGADLPPDIRIDCDYDPSLPDLWADREQLIQAFLNLVRNAVQAVDEAGCRPGRVLLRTRVRRRVTIAGRHHRLLVQVDVIDNGPGVPEHLREQIFHPLITGRPTGTGLGLSIAQSLISRHEGCINFHSEPGNTVFSVLLPIAGEHR